MKTVRSETLKILTSNYVILSGILGPDKNSCLIDKLALEKLGFRFNYVTDVENQYGVLHYGVFDMTYRIVKNKRILITVDKERHPISPFIFKRWDREIRETMR